MTMDTSWLGKIVEFNDDAVLKGEVTAVSTTPRGSRIDFDMMIGTKGDLRVFPLYIHFNDVDEEDFKLLFREVER